MKRRTTPLRSIKRLFGASHLWYLSTRAYKAGLIPLAYAIKMFAYIFYGSLLCFQCEIEDDIMMVHFGWGCVVHPNVTVGHRVKFMHHVSIAAETLPGSNSRVVIEDDVVIGMYAIILGNDDGGIRIGKGAVIGAGAIVTRDVPAGAVILPMPSRPAPMAKKYAPDSETTVATEPLPRQVNVNEKG